MPKQKTTFDVIGHPEGAERAAAPFALLMCVVVLQAACGFSGGSNRPDAAEFDAGELDASAGFYRVVGQRIEDGQGGELRARGVQLDFGSLRGDMPAGLEGALPDDFQDALLDYVVVEQDFDLLVSMHVNVVRLSLNTHLDFLSTDAPDSYKEENLQRLDRVVLWAAERGILLVLSMRQSPGGHNTGPHSGSDGANGLWDGAAHRSQLAALWQQIATRYALEPTVLGYDLLNEPTAPSAEALNEVYAELAAAVRAVDEHHILFLEGNDWGTRMDAVDGSIDSNAALSMHFYWPGPYAIEGQGDYPQLGGEVVFDRSEICAKVDERLASIAASNAAVWVGEFGAQTAAGNYGNYDRDVIGCLEDRQLSWSYYQFKNLRGDSEAHGIYWVLAKGPLSEILRALAAGTPWSAISEPQRQSALESVATENCGFNQELASVLTAELARTLE